MTHFLHPGLLFFLVLAAIPGVLYLLFRLRRHEVDWGATYVLRLTLRSGRRRGRWQQAAIIALRTIVLAALVAAFARPFLPYREGAAGRFVHPAGTLHRVVLIDNSRSMLAAHGATHRLDAARGVVADLLASTRPGDTCHVVTLCPDRATGRVSVRSVSCPMRRARASQVAAEVAPGDTPASLAAALPAVLAAFREAAAASRQLVLLTDLARSDHPSIGDYEIFGAMLGKLGVHVATLGLGSHQVGNVALESLAAGSDVLLAHQPTNLYLDVMNYSDGASTDLLLQFRVDGKVAREETVALTAGQRKTVTYAVALPPGEHSLACILAPDAYGADNRIERFVRVAKGLRVLAVVPRTDEQDPFRREGEFLRRLLGAPAAFGLEVERIAADTLLPKSFRGRDVAFLCGVAKLAQPTREALGTFVRRGGGLILSVAPGLDAAEFNRTYGQLLPFPLAEPFRTAFDEERYLAIQPSDVPALLLREFEHGLNSDLSAGRVYNHFRLRRDEGDGAEAQTLLALSNGDPLLVGRRFGKGRVLLWTTTQGASWNSLVVHQAHLPLLYRLMHHAAEGRGPRVNVAPGEPLICQVDEGAELFMTTPDKKLARCTISASGDAAFIRFEQTDTPGTYTLSDASGAPLASFSVALPPGESDLRVLRDDEAKRFEGALGTAISHDTAELQAAMAVAGGGVERAGWLLIAVLLVLVLDGFLTRVWFR